MQTTLLGCDQGRAWTFLWMLAALIQAVCKWDGPVASRTWHMEGLLGLQQENKDEDLCPQGSGSEAALEVCCRAEKAGWHCS